MPDAITKDWIIQDVLLAYGEQAAQVMLDHGIHCIGCHFSMFETLEQGCAVHGLDVEELLSDLNEVAKELPGDNANKK